MTDEPIFEASAPEGLEFLAEADLLALRGTRELRLSGPGALRFAYLGHPDDLLDLRSVLSIYRVAHFAVPRPKALLGNTELRDLLALLAAVRALWTPHSFQTLSLSAAGSESPVMQRLHAELAQRTGLAAAEDGDLLLRLRPARDGGWDALVRISPRPLSARSWRVENLPGALNAVVAHGVMRLTEPDPEDVIVNLGCGSGTLLVERLLLGPARAALGVDNIPRALAATRANLAAAGLADAVELEREDVTALSLPDGVATVICADLPYGQLVGTHAQNEQLYPAMLDEAARIAAPGARLALITHEVRLLERVFAERADRWQLERTLRVRTAGLAPVVVLATRR